MSSNRTILGTQQTQLRESIRDYGKSGDKIQDEITTTKHLVTCTMLVYTTVHPIF